MTAHAVPASAPTSWTATRIAGLLVLWVATVLAWRPLLGAGWWWSAIPALGAAAVLSGHLAPRIAARAVVAWLPLSLLLAGVPLSALAPRALGASADDLASGAGELAVAARGPVVDDPWPLAAALLVAGPVLVLVGWLLRRGRPWALAGVALAGLPLGAAVALTQVDDGAWPGAALVAGAVLCLARGRVLALVPATAVLVGGTVAIAQAVAPEEPWLPFALVDRPAPFTRLDTGQSYGPLNDRRTGRTMLEIDADEPALWRMQALDRFDGHGWAVGRRWRFGRYVDDALPQPRATEETMTVTVRGLRNQLVVAPGRVTAVDGNRSLREVGGEAREVARRPRSGGTYEVTAEVVRADVADLEGVQIPTDQRYDRWTRLRPYGGGPPRGDGLQLLDWFGDDEDPWREVRRIADELGDDAGSQLEVVRRVRDHLRSSGRYRYTTDVPRAGADPLLDFLTTTRAGYCQQFAGAAALLLRLNGVPTRVVSGFATGTREHGRWVVRDQDAHAWIEVYFPGTGWVPFDVTPAGDAATVDDVDPLAAAATGRGTGGGSGGGWLAGGALALLGAGGAAYAVRRRRGRERGDDGELGELLARLAGAAPATSLRELQEPLGAIGPSVGALALRVERERFAPGDAGDEVEVAPRRRAWRALRQDVGAARASWLLARDAVRRATR
ncbi:transglutaminaseTgpA domain-containing protein [Patulibacter brassicae]|uniref:TransglutaminaseTgpA domain-containing protein n=1 Tax=Patulibacter brassicae TaxID=1705717 RepID=A0ABU4VP25_9ACTN|nr:transglutaminaseTgpA domain-containing protein [Patulibacter brassicae]MDX8152809.1 transglutaminaseTgpA domain-containing protein [Patulibacter brassicae]